MKKNNKKGFTLVELLAVIVILAIILVIAVPKVMSVINDSKKATLESTAKMIASTAEKVKVQNQVLGNNNEIRCEDVVKMNDVDYEFCNIEFEGNTAKVTLVGKGKFEGLNVCNGTKTNSSGVDKPCSEVCTENEVLTEIKQIGIKNKSTCNTYITGKVTGTPYATLLPLVVPLCNGEDVQGMNTEAAINYLISMGLFTKEELVENNVIEEKINKYCKPNLPEKGATYISRIYNDPSSGLMEPIIKYTTEDNKEEKVNAGIRYTGSDPNNRVYFNCEAKDSNNISYGNEGYKYDESCEVWRIIGVFNVQDGSGNKEKRLKIINTESTFKASWDSSASNINNGWGINQWGESTYSNGSKYKGADLMQLLNGYYIGKENSTCKYCDGQNQEICENTCTKESLTSSKMKPLTSVAKNMITNAKWDTYGVEGMGVVGISYYYLEEKGISTQHTGKNLCEGQGYGYCNDTVNRTTNWTGLVGLMSIYDILGANGWLYSPTIDGELLYPWSISPNANSVDALGVWLADSGSAGGINASGVRGVWPAVYLKSNIQIISGDGSEGNEYKLSA